MSLPKMLRSRFAVLVTCFFLVAASACSNPDAEANLDGPGGFVQDLWVIDRVATLDHNDQRLELTDLIVDHLAAQQPDTSVEIHPGVTFHEYSVLQGGIIDTELDPLADRQDVTITAGLLQNEHGTSLSLLATPDPHTTNPIYFKDVVKFDLTFLDDLIEPGDPLIYDYAFLQSIPQLDGAENDLAPLELLRHRMAKNSVKYFGTKVDGEPKVLVYANEIGMVMHGSKYAAFPPKSQDMMEGFEAGTRECVKKFRGTPLECVEEFFTNFIDGVSDSWELIDEQIEFVNTEVVEMRKAYHDEFFNPKKKPPLKQPKLSDCFPDSSNPPGGGSGDESAGSDFGGNAPGGSSSADCDTPTPTGGGGNGEPHFRTFDGVMFDMQGVGEYVLAQHDELTVQIRTSVAGSRVTAISAAAIGFGENRFMVSGDKRWLNGSEVTDEVIELPGVEIVNKAHIVTFEFTSGRIVRVINPLGWTLNVEVWHPGEGTWSGLLGNYDGDPNNDFTTRDGRVYAGEPLFVDMYEDYAESWRITQAESLFVYADGEDTETWTDRSFPGSPMSIAELPEKDRRIAERLCLAADIQHEQVFENCVLDVALMSDLDNLRIPAELGAVRTARSADSFEASNSRRGARDGRRAPTPPPPPGQESSDTGDREDDFDPTMDPASWLVTGYDLLGDSSPRKHVQCSPNGIPQPLWGGQGSYAMESSVCTAAVHAGKITLAKGGLVLVHRTFDPDVEIDFRDFDDFPGYESFDGVRSLSRPAGPSFHFADEDEGGFIIDNYGTDGPP